MHIIFTAADGRTGIMTPAKKEDVTWRYPEVKGLTDSEYASWVMSKDLPVGASSPRVVSSNDLVPVRDNWSFRDALKNDLSFDKPKCVELTKERLRLEREPLLQKLDTDYIRAIETGAPTDAITTEKQRLRDITLIPNASMTLEELKAIKP